MIDVSIEKRNGVHTHIATLIARNTGVLYPNVFIEIRYQLDPKTNLFLWKHEDSIQVRFSKHGFNAISSFETPKTSLHKDMSFDKKTFSFSINIKMRVGDAKASAKVEDSGIDFSLPSIETIFHVWGELTTKGEGWARSAEL